VTSSNTKKIRLAIAILTAFVILASTGLSVSAASPTATHIYPGLTKTGKAIPINVTIDPHNTMPISVTAYWWTSLSENRNQASLMNDSFQPKNWRGQIPAQPSPCEVYYTIQIDYLYYNDIIGAQSTDTIYLPGITGNYLVSVKGELFGNLSPLAVAVGIALMILAVGIIIYAQRIVARVIPRYDDLTKARKEPVEPEVGERDDTSAQGPDAEEKTKGAPPSS
jgi:hypothetical protein